MKAAVHTRYGPPEVVRVTEVDTPTVDDGQLLVRVHAATVNRTDAAYRLAKPFFVRSFTGLVRPKVTVLGNEFAGVVEAVGAGVESFGVGDRVFGYNEGPFGAHAEYMTVSATGSVAHMAARSTFEEAAASTEGAHYALAYFRKAKIGAGHDILVNGATGAIGSAAVQLAKSVGATVTAVCAGPHVELVEDLGADRVIDYTVEDFTQDRQTYDVVLDAVGKSTFGRCKRLLKPGGVYCSSELGPLAQNLILPVVTPLFGRRKVMFAIPRHDQEMMTYFRELIEVGAFKPLIDRRYPLDEIVAAYRYVETGQKIGSVVLEVGTDPR